MQGPPPLGRQRRDQVLFGRSQDPLKAEYAEITNKVGLNIIGAPAHVIPFKATKSFTNSGFDCSLGFQSDLRLSPLLAVSGQQKSLNLATEHHSVALSRNPSK